jgi:hypothetical protein
MPCYFGGEAWQNEKNWKTCIFVNWKTLQWCSNCLLLNDEIQRSATALFWVFTLRVIIIPCRLFGTTYPKTPVRKSWPLKIGPIECPETSVTNYHCSLRNNPEECSCHLLRRGSLKPTTEPLICLYTFVMFLLIQICRRLRSATAVFYVTPCATEL